MLLGKEVRDTVTGRQGMVTGRAVYLDKEPQIYIDTGEDEVVGSWSKESDAEEIE